MKSRDIDWTKKAEVKEANMYFFIEAAIALFVSFLINVFVVSVFAEGLYNKTNSLCLASNNSHADQFLANPNSTVEADLYKGGIFLGCTYGNLAMYVWAIRVLAAGQSSTMTGAASINCFVSSSSSSSSSSTFCPGTFAYLLFFSQYDIFR